ncbi:putative reverse transcriptase domain-containing protein [Tanacetum coccineum]
MYDSRASRLRLFIKGTKHVRMMLDSIDNGPLVYPTGEENGQPRPKKYSELTEAQQLQDDCDVQATNIILHILPPDVYALVNHQEAAKDIWDKVKMLMKGTELSYQEHKCRLYNLFDKFDHVPVQVNTKFLNALPSEWSKFITDVKLAKSLYTTNYDQLYAYLSQHERHANEVRINRERYPDSLSFVANSPTLYNPSQSPQHSSYSMYPPPQQFTTVYAAPIDHQNRHTPVNLQGEDSIECLNKAMAFLSAVASRFPPSNNQLRTSANPRNQVTIQDGNRGIATTSKGNVTVGPPRVVKCYNCQGEGHMARQCTQPKRPRNPAWFKKKLMLAEAQEAEQALVKNSSLSETPVTSHTPVRIEAPRELPMAAVEQCSVDKNIFEIQIKQLRIDNDQLLNQIMSQEIIHIVANSVDILYLKKSCVNDCSKCLELEIELSKKKYFIEKEAYDKLVKSYSNLETHCISLELATQLNQEIFQRENSGKNLNAPTFNQLFEINCNTPKLGRSGIRISGACHFIDQ